MFKRKTTQGEIRKKRGDARDIITEAFTRSEKLALFTPIPVLDTVIASLTHSSMIFKLSTLYNTPLTEQECKELCKTLNFITVERALSSLSKFIRYYGTIIGGVATRHFEGKQTLGLGLFLMHHFEAQEIAKLQNKKHNFEYPSKEKYKTYMKEHHTFFMQNLYLLQIYKPHNSYSI